MPHLLPGNVTSKYIPLSRDHPHGAPRPHLTIEAPLRRNLEGF